jgi:xylulokinase
MTVLLGVDVATAAVRATAVDPAGSVVATAARALPEPARPRPGWSEQHASYADTAFDTLRAVGRELAGRPVAGLAVTSTSGTVVPCDERGTAIGDALMYDDRRADGDWPAALGRVAWLDRHRPAPRYLHVADVVVAALAGGIQPTDTSHALKTGADPETLRWPAGLLSRLRVDPGTLPALNRPGAVVAGVSSEAATRTGLPPGTPIVLGMTDGCTGQIAAGAVSVGDAVGVLGTTLVVKTATPTRPEADGGTLYSHRAPDGLWWPGGASNVGAGALLSAFPGADLAALDAAAGRRGPAGVCCYPLTRRGERFPFAEPDAEGFWMGEPRDDVEAFRALLEGVAFTERLGLAMLAGAGGAATGPLRAVGGASRCDVWLRIRATVTGRPVCVPAHPTSSFGAAVLAASATTHRGLNESVAAMVRPARTVHPDERERDALEESNRRFLAGLRDRGYLPSAQGRPED